MYVVDLIDLETSRASGGNARQFSADHRLRRTPDDNTDDGQAIRHALPRPDRRAGRLDSSGTFAISTPIPNDKGIDVADVTIQGADMWHSTLKGPYVRLPPHRTTVCFADFAIVGEATTRDESCQKMASPARPVLARVSIARGLPLHIPKSAGGLALADRE